MVDLFSGEQDRTRVCEEDSLSGSRAGAEQLKHPETLMLKEKCEERSQEPTAASV